MAVGAIESEVEPGEEEVVLGERGERLLRRIRQDPRVAERPENADQCLLDALLALDD